MSDTLINIVQVDSRYLLPTVIGSNILLDNIFKENNPVIYMSYECFHLPVEFMIKC